jgi:predicted amidohydrolase
MRVALAQVDCRVGEVGENVARAATAVAEARALGADLVVFPELALTGYGAGGSSLAADGAEVAALTDGAGDTAVLVGFRESSGHNSAAYLEGGALVHLHRKVQLAESGDFDEDRLYVPGDELRAFDARGGRFATLICNDAWHPHLAFLAVQDGARVLFVPAASSLKFPDVESYWRDIVRFYARLLECYVVFVNRVGEDSGLAFWGGSHVVDPYGRTVAEAPRFEEALVVAEIDPAAVDERRREWPLVDEPRLAVLERELARIAGGRAVV